MIRNLPQGVPVDVIRQLAFHLFQLQNHQPPVSAIQQLCEVCAAEDDGGGIRGLGDHEQASEQGFPEDIGRDACGEGRVFHEWECDVGEGRHRLYDGGRVRRRVDDGVVEAEMREPIKAVGGETDGAKAEDAPMRRYIVCPLVVRLEEGKGEVGRKAFEERDILQ